MKTMIEWSLPPWRFRKLGTPGFFLSSARPALFTSVLGTDQDQSSIRRKVGNAGLQIDFRFKVMSKFDMTLSVGAATAFEDGRSASDEFMFSLNVLN
ncbi:MAG: hypothetical protein GTN83_07105 [Acidobacteria bacterium]|nr:hypothetical protein [Acidobacteriota bacterium]